MPHVTSFVVRFSDLDPYDHVNHARYLSLFESARIELLEEMGFGMGTMRDVGYQIVLTELTARFHAAAGLHDVLTVTTEVAEVRRATSRWRQEALREGARVCSLEVTAAFTGLDGRPRRAPDGFAEAAARISPPAPRGG